MTNNKQTRLNIFLDANVVVKILEGYEVPELFESANESEVFTSVICFNIVAYLWEIGKIKCSQADLDMFFNNINLLSVNQMDCFKALEISKYEDIEDGIEILCAQNNQMDKLLTYDKKMFNKYGKNVNLPIILCK